MSGETIKSGEDSYVMNPYDHFKAYDIVGMLRQLLDSGSFHLRPEDGKIKPSQISIAKDTPWIHVKHTANLKCGIWHQVTFNHVVMNLPPGQRFVPRHCQSCWKVVVKPRTLQQLFNLLELQKELDRPSKCGIETRDSVSELYGGYFYNKSIEQGLNCYEAVKAKMTENPILVPLLDEVDGKGRTTRIILKRGCTEFEHLLGDSRLWHITPEQEFVEDLIDNYFVDDGFSLSQPEHVIWSIKRRWIEWAFKNGDQTYLRYTGGKPLYPAYVTYHQPELLESPHEVNNLTGVEKTS
jgi:hypothetical protein